MAVKPLTPAEQQELNSLLEENAQIVERISILNEKIASAVGSERTQLEDMMEQEKIRLKLQQDVTTAYKKRQEFLDYEEDAIESIASLSAKARKEIDGKAKSTSSLNSVTQEIVKMKQKELTLDGDALQKSIARRETLEELRNAVIEQAQSLSKAHGESVSHGEKREQFEHSIAHLTKKQKEEARELFKIKEALEKKEERLEMLHEQQHELMHHLPQFMKDALDTTKGLIKSFAKLGPLALVFAAAGAALHAFVELDKAAEDFRKETGLTLSQTKELAHQAHHIEMYYRDIGVELKDVFDTAKALKEQFSDSANFSEEVLTSLVVMGKNFGISADSAAKVQSIFESVGGLSSETAANVQMQVAEMSNLAGVAPEKVFKDIAENAEAASTFFKGDLTALTKNAIQAQRMGTSLKQQVSLAEKLLDFESSIEQELVAATFVGGQFNLTQARALAAAGKTQAANEEVLKQLQRGGDFRKKDYWTQTELAKATGMTADEINKQLNMQEKMNGLSEEEKKLATDAIDKGLDISNMSKEQLREETKKLAAQQEQQGQLTRMQNAFMGITATIGGTLSPLLEGLATILNLVLIPINAIVEGMAHFVDYVKQSAPLLSVLLGIVTAIAVQKGLVYLNTKNELGVTIAKAAYEKMSLAVQAKIELIKKKGLLKTIYDYALSAASSIAKTPFIGWALAAGVAATAIGYGMSLYSKAGDVMSPADGKTRISTKEGGLYELSPNDDLVAAPGAAEALSNISKPAATEVMDDTNLVSKPTTTEPLSNISKPITNEVIGGNNLVPTPNKVETIPNEAEALSNISKLISNLSELISNKTIGDNNLVPTPREVVAVQDEAKTLSNISKPIVNEAMGSISDTKIATPITGLENNVENTQQSNLQQPMVNEPVNTAAVAQPVSSKIDLSVLTSPLNSVVAEIRALRGDMGGYTNSGTGGEKETGKMDSLINEIKGLRTDLLRGKIGVNMDGVKVTSRISGVVDKIGSNSYAKV